MLPLAVPEKIFGLALSLDFFDRCANPCSLHPPPAALAGVATDFARSVGKARLLMTVPQLKPIEKQKERHDFHRVFLFGCSCQARTDDIMINSHALYRLS